MIVRNELKGARVVCAFLAVGFVTQLSSPDVGVVSAANTVDTQISPEILGGWAMLTLTQSNVMRWDVGVPGGTLHKSARFFGEQGGPLRVVEWEGQDTVDPPGSYNEFTLKACQFETGTLPLICPVQAGTKPEVIATSSSTDPQKRLVRVDHLLWLPLIKK